MGSGVRTWTHALWYGMWYPKQHPIPCAKCLPLFACFLVSLLPGAYSPFPCHLQPHISWLGVFPKPHFILFFIFGACDIPILLVFQSFRYLMVLLELKHALFPFLLLFLGNSKIIRGNKKQILDYFHARHSKMPSHRLQDIILIQNSWESRWNNKYFHKCCLNVTGISANHLSCRYLQQFFIYLSQDQPPTGCYNFHLSHLFLNWVHTSLSSHEGIP